MADLLHHQSDSEPSDPAVERHNARLGMILFVVYLAGYGAYVLVNAFAPKQMDALMPGGLNAAVASGLGLIIGAIVLSGVYLVFSRSPKGERQ